MPKPGTSKSANDKFKKDSLADYEKMASIQLVINQHFFNEINKLYRQLQGEVELEQAIGILISTISTNLGVILAQMPESLQPVYLRVATNIIQQSLLQTIENISVDDHGQIGHA